MLRREPEFGALRCAFDRRQRPWNRYPVRDRLDPRRIAQEFPQFRLSGLGHRHESSAIAAQTDSGNPIPNEGTFCAEKRGALGDMNCANAGYIRQACCMDEIKAILQVLLVNMQDI